MIRFIVNKAPSWSALWFHSYGWEGNIMSRFMIIKVTYIARFMAGRVKYGIFATKYIST